MGRTVAAKTWYTEEFTSSDTWVVPAGVNAARITLVGAGAGGGSGAVASYGAADKYARGGGGGGSGEVLWDVPIVLTPGETCTITLGAGGAGGAQKSGAGYGNAGSNGGESLFIATSITLTAEGGFAGSGGYYSSSSAHQTLGGGGGGDLGATIDTTGVYTPGNASRGWCSLGGNAGGSTEYDEAHTSGTYSCFDVDSGTVGTSDSNASAYCSGGGGGAPSPFSDGANGGDAHITATGDPGSAATGPGAGGGGGGAGSTSGTSTSGAGGVGYKGYCMVKYFA